MKRNLTTFLLLTTCAFNGALAQKKPSSPLPGIQEPLPNIVLIMTDDQGYADVGKFGATGFKTPNLDKMADDGLRFTNWYVPQAVCGASRAGLLTGCYPNRIGMLGAPGPSSKYGISKNEVLLPELMKQKGYTSALFGKWHLGHHEKFLPLQHGFDEYYGLPYSNDMWPYHPGVRHLPLEQRLKKWPHLPMMEGNKIINKERPRNQDPGHLHQRQRPVAQLRQSRWQRGPPPRRQSDHLGRWTTGPLHRPMDRPARAWRSL